MSNVSKAAQIAAAAHAGAMDKQGQPYILHVLRVGLAGRTEAEQIVGFLHDVLEDTDYPSSALYKEFGDEIMQALSAITRGVGEGYRAYIDRAARNPLARQVKIFDLRDNLRPGCPVTMLGRYQAALDTLEECYWETVIGKRFERLLVQNRAPNQGTRAAWHCLCDCGGQIIVNSWSLIHGRVKSCGCLRRERLNNQAKHGCTARDSRTSEYQSWVAMHNRCTNSRQKAYKDYGGRGITICDRWQGEHGFENFLADMGPRPAGTSLDRFPNNDGNYQPDNCRWATIIQQNNNTRRQK